MKDRFSNHAKQYATFRPTYPEALYDFILAQINATSVAWDAGTGNGQVATRLAQTFDQVIATDISEAQLSHAPRKENIIYRVGDEMIPSIQNNSIDLITVAQAIHWFDRPKFYQEVNRVLKPDGIIALWGYGLIEIDSAIDVIIKSFYTQEVGSYWDIERKHIDNHYQSIGFPFQEIKSPAFSMQFRWNLSQLKGYLSTWSAVQKFKRERTEDPVEKLVDRIEPLLPDFFHVSFPLFLRIGRVTDKH